MAKLSISRAWDEARAVLGRDGSLLTTIALAMLVLPGVVSDLFSPEAKPGELPDPGAWMIVTGISILIGIVGQLAIVHLAIGSRATVGEAIGHGLKRMPYYVTATLVWALPLSLLVYFAVRNVAPPSPSAGAALGLLVLLPLIVFVFVRMLMTAPVASAEDANPIDILKRSWALTRGNWWMLFAFVVMLLIAAAVIVIAVGAIIGILSSLIFGEPEPFSVGALVSSLLTQLAGAAITVVFVVMLARIYVQLAGRGQAQASVPSSGT